MREQLRPRHIMGMVAMVCAAAVATPVAVQAAGGSPVTITDPTLSRSARVTASGALFVENRPGPGPAAGAFSAYRVTQHLSQAPRRTPLALITGPNWIALTNLSMSFYNVGSEIGIISVYRYLRTSGTTNCGSATASTSPPAGYVISPLAKYYLRPMSVQTVSLSGPPLTAGAGTGQLVCIAIGSESQAPSWTTNVTATGYTYPA